MSEPIIICPSDNFSEAYLAAIKAVTELGHAMIVAGDCCRDFAMAFAHCDVPVSVYIPEMPASYDWFIHDVFSADLDHEYLGPKNGEAIGFFGSELSFMRGLIDIKPTRLDVENLLIDYQPKEWYTDPKVKCTKPYQERSKPARILGDNFIRSGFRSSGKLARGRI